MDNSWHASAGMWIPFDYGKHKGPRRAGPKLSIVNCHLSIGYVIQCSFLPSIGLTNSVLF